MQVTIKKFVSILAAAVMIMCLGSGAFAGDEESGFPELYAKYSSDSEINIAVQIAEKYSTDEQFIQHLSSNRQSAILMLQQVIDAEIRQSKFASLYSTGSNWYDGEHSISTVPIITQRTTSSCGAASALQAVCAKGYANSVAGNTMTDKQIQMEKDTGIYGTSDGAMVYRVAQAINKYTDATLTDSVYAYVEMTNIGKEDFKKHIVESLMCGGPAILHAKPNYLTSYYPSTATSGHYIAVKSINTDTNTIIVSDCNWNSRYNGEFTVTIDEAYNSVHSVAGRYLLYMPYA